MNAVGHCVDKEDKMENAIELKDTTPSYEEAMKRYNEILSGTFSPPLSDAEKANIKASCLAGGCVFIRCAFEECE
jgi:hypothetical protein